MGRRVVVLGRVESGRDQRVKGVERWRSNQYQTRMENKESCWN